MAVAMSIAFRSFGTCYSRISVHVLIISLFLLSAKEMWLEKMLAAGVKTDAFSYNSVINVWQPSKSTEIGRGTG